MPLARLIVLASTSRYRRQLMERLGVPFVVATPDVDETPLAGEVPAATAQRLAAAKAQAVAAAHADALIVGSDQVADCDGVAVSKPADHAGAVAQLTAQSGRTIVFHTAVALLDSRLGTFGTALVDVRSTFRVLDARTIEAYLRRDKPYDCAGAVRAESLGITLFERIDSDDPTALIGLPLIALSRLMRDAGVDVVKALP
ncbi:MAG TPA: Maf family nucleotide pyrophosphatase [Casimicrobiaceae bacterium]|jgi:septum formation protein